jgi:hypothetical protein
LQHLLLHLRPLLLRVLPVLLRGLLQPLLLLHQWPLGVLMGLRVLIWGWEVNQQGWHWHCRQEKVTVKVLSWK